MASSLRGWVITGSISLAGLIATPIADSLVKEGKLPAWLALKIEGVLSVLTAPTPWAFWELMLIVLSIGGIALFFLHREELVVLRQANQIDHLSIELGKYKKRAAMLESSKTELESAKADLEASKAALEQQLLESPQVADEVDIQISPLAFNVLNAIAMFTDAKIHPLLSHLEQSIGAGRVATHAAIDTLLLHKLVEEYDTPNDLMYEFTPKGRAFYIERKAKQEA